MTRGVTRAFDGGIVATDLDDGMLVRQGGEAYVARNWQLAPATIELIRTATSLGLGCMIREDHPRRNARWPNRRGVVYLAFSPDPTGQWSLAIDSFVPRRGDYGAAVFNGKYHTQFVRAGLAFTFEKRNRASGHLVVAREQVIPTICALSAFDHGVLALNHVRHLDP